MGYTLGIDEVGRGCLAGPVYLAGVIIGSSLPKHCFHFDNTDVRFEDFKDLKLVRDSKKLNSKKRDIVAELIDHYRFKNLVLSANNTLIDEFGIGVCLSHLLILLIWEIKKSLENLDIIVDGQIKVLNELNPGLVAKIALENNLDVDSVNLQKLIEEIYTKKLNITRENKADDKYLSIALASNLAKVQRDNYMTELGKNYPDFDWQTNKGYGTVKNRQAIKKNMTNKYLRQSFLGNLKKSETIVF